MECELKQDCKNCSYFDPAKIKSVNGCTFIKWWIGEKEPRFKPVDYEKLIEEMCKDPEFKQEFDKAQQRHREKAERVSEMQSEVLGFVKEFKEGDSK